MHRSGISGTRRFARPWRVEPAGDEARAWLPELFDCLEILAAAQAEQGVIGIYARPDPAYSLRIIALREIVAETELIGIYEQHGNLREYPLEGEDAQRAPEA